MSRVPDDLLAAVRSRGCVVLATHVNPDGDALGSQLGLADILAGMGKDVLCYLEEPVPHLYRFLPGSDRVVTDLQQVERFAEKAADDILCISLDCGDLQRLGGSGRRLGAIHPFAVIDHHRGNNGFGDLAWIEPDRSSTGEMIYDLAVELDRPISSDCATCLYTAIVTDTGSFRYESTSSHTFAVAGELVALGVRPDAMAERLFDNYSVGRLQLLQRVLATLEMYDDNRIAVIRVTGEMLRQTGSTMEDTENFINLPRAVNTVEVAVFLKDKGGTVAVSMRAKGRCDVSRVAARFGGGGHRNASGFRVAGCSLDGVRDMLIPVLERELAQ
ncbi:MAG TPA: bifunctional oligoribonuclease/PAP phosphatase NrnA [Desulfobulbus sp.]|nr:bifunctional oligoribonuclease/PAP phosphatase NrnA [Desulfobulbus sp.]